MMLLKKFQDVFELNTGVIFYKNNVKMMTFLSNWLSVFLNNKKNLYRQHGKGGEQVSLRYLLYNDKDIRMHILSSPWTAQYI